MAGVSDACWEHEDLLSAYLDGELLDGELDVVVGHLDLCARCRSSFHAIKEARTAVRMLPQLDPPSLLFGGYHVGDGLSAYLDGELTTGETGAVTAHLVECTGCRQELHDLDGARTAVRALPGVELPADLVMVGAPHRSRSVRKVVTLVAAAAVAVATLGLTIARDDTVAPLDLDNLATRHNARVSVDPGFSVIPASVSAGSTP